MGKDIHGLIDSADEFMQFCRRIADCAQKIAEEQFVFTDSSAYIGFNCTAGTVAHELYYYLRPMQSEEDFRIPVRWRNLSVNADLHDSGREFVSLADCLARMESENS